MSKEQQPQTSEKIKQKKEALFRITKRELFRYAAYSLYALASGGTSVAIPHINQKLEDKYAKKVKETLQNNLQRLENEEESSLKGKLPGIIGLIQAYERGERLIKVNPDWQEKGEISFGKGDKRVVIGNFYPALSSSRSLDAREKKRLFDKEKRALVINLISESAETFEDRAQKFITRFKELNKDNQFLYVNVCDTVPSKHAELIREMNKMGFAALTINITAKQTTENITTSSGKASLNYEDENGNIIFIRQEMLEFMDLDLQIVPSCSGRVSIVEKTEETKRMFEDEEITEIKYTKELNAANYSTLLLTGQLPSGRWMEIGLDYRDWLSSEENRLQDFINIAKAIIQTAEDKNISVEDMVVILLGDTNPNGLGMNRSRTRKFIREVLNLLATSAAQSITGVNEAEAQKKIFKKLNTGLEIFGKGRTLSSLKHQGLHYKFAIWCLNMRTFRGLKNRSTNFNIEKTRLFNEVSDHFVMTLEGINLNQTPSKTDANSPKPINKNIDPTEEKKALEYIREAKNEMARRLLAIFLPITTAFLINNLCDVYGLKDSSNRNNAPIQNQEEIEKIRQYETPIKDHGNSDLQF